MSELSRKLDIEKLSNLLDVFPVAAILGPRQCGKTTLCKEFSPDYFYDLENPEDAQKLENPKLNLEKLSGTIAIDEIQRKPDIFPILRYLVDNHPEQKYILLGSASPLLIKHTSETLAGRIGYCFLSGFSLEDVGVDKMESLWLNGGFPRSFLAKSQKASYLWRENYVQTFLERDIPLLGIQIPSQTLRRFWTMLAHYHGQILNYSELARSFGISDKTVRNYIEILEGTFMLRTLQPWYVNIGKRLIKNPKLYFIDSGIYHYFSSLSTYDDLMSSPKSGASFEGFVIQIVIQTLGISEKNFYFWRTNAGAEMDLFWQSGGKSYGIEVKLEDAPKKTKSMQFSIQDLELEQLFVIYPGKDSYKLSEKITVVPITKLSYIKNSTQI